MPDLAITKVSRLKNQYTVLVTNIGTKPVPVDLLITYNEGSTQSVHQSIACWENGSKTVTLHFTTKKRVQKIVLGTGYDADVNKTDNIWVPK